MTPAVVTPDILTLLNGPGLRGVALEDGHRSVSRADLGASVRGWAGALVRHGVSRGDRVAVLVPNCAAAVELYLACALLGAIWVGVNPATPDAERDRQCRLVSPTLIVTASPPSSNPESGRVVELTTLSNDRTASFDAAPPELATPCAIAFSSGTSGTPKAVVHSRTGVSLAATALAEVHLRRDDRVGVVLPMSIHNVMVVGGLAPLIAGGTCVAVDRMNAAGVAAACRDRQLTMLSALVPTTIYDLVHDHQIAARTLASLRLAGTGAAGLPESLRSAFEAKFGVGIVGSYGMTEAPGVVCIEDTRAAHAPGASGRPLPHVVVSACDPHGRRLPAGQQGELMVCAADGGEWDDLYRPPIGTWSKDGLVRRSPAEKRFRTGDYGWVGVDGTIHVGGRKADVIIRGGVNVNAAELESILGKILGVRDVAVLGEYDERLGQRIVAFVEPDSAATVDAVQLRQQACGMLSHGKVPDEFVVGVLPRNAMGKVARTQLIRRTNQ